MNTIELLVFPVHGQKTCATKEMLEDIPFVVLHVSKNDEGEEVETPVPVLPTEPNWKEVVVASFPGSQWESITLKEEWTGQQDTELKRSIRRYDTATRQYLTDDLSYQRNFIARALVGWTFFDNSPVTPEGYDRLSIDVRDVIFSVVQQRFYPTFADALPLLTPPRQTV